MVAAALVFSFRIASSRCSVSTVLLFNIRASSIQNRRTFDAFSSRTTSVVDSKFSSLWGRRLFSSSSFSFKRSTDIVLRMLAAFPSLSRNSPSNRCWGVILLQRRRSASSLLYVSMRDMFSENWLFIVSFSSFNLCVNNVFISCMCTTKLSLSARNYSIVYCDTTIFT